MTDTRKVPAGGDSCPKSRREDNKHGWEFDGDDPYVVCAFCGERRDALTNRMIVADNRPSPPMPIAAETAVVTQPDSAGICGLTLEELKNVVKTRIATAFHDCEVEESELKRRSDWVVCDMESWGTMSSPVQAQIESECSCYEAEFGHQPGCAFYRTGTPHAVGASDEEIDELICALDVPLTDLNEAWKRDRKLVRKFLARWSAQTGYDARAEVDK